MRNNKSKIVSNNRKKKLFSLKLNPLMIEQIRDKAAERNESMAELIRLCVEMQIKKL
jgi:hypothetical protein